MAKTYDAEKDEMVEIASLQVLNEMNEDEMVKVDTIEDFKQLVECMGWSSYSQWLEDTGVAAEELLGKWWCVMHNKVYCRD